MTDDTDDADGETAAVSTQYLPMYEYEDDGRGMGDVVSKVPRGPQIDALRSVAGDGTIEPDGWVEGYNMTIPVIDGVPITVLERSRPARGKRRGVEASVEYVVDDSIGLVRLDKAFNHPGNTSKIKVESKATTNTS